MGVKGEREATRRGRLTWHLRIKPQLCVVSA